MIRRLLAVAVLLAAASPAWAEERPRRSTGTAAFLPKADDHLPSRYRLEPHQFPYQLALKSELPLSGYAIQHLTFPSPVDTLYAENNTVHAEYYQPTGQGPFPAVIVLEILQGGEPLARGLSSVLAQNRVAALFVRMAYYGPRRPKGEKVRLMSANVPHTIEAFRQTVLDCRRATAWLESRPEIDGSKLGICGTSMGSFLAALTAEMEPKLSKVAVLYGGGGFVDGYAEHPVARPYIEALGWIGGTRDILKSVVAPVDPITHAANLKDRDLLIVAARKDDIVPPKMAEMLWEASGKQKIIWQNTSHYGAAMYALATLQHVLDHFQWK